MTPRQRLALLRAEKERLLVENRSLTVTSSMPWTPRWLARRDGTRAAIREVDARLDEVLEEMTE